MDPENLERNEGEEMKLKKVPLTMEQLKDQRARAEQCAEATIPGDQLRELIRLAIVGKKTEEQLTIHEGDLE